MKGIGDFMDDNRKFTTQVIHLTNDDGSAQKCDVCQRELKQVITTYEDGTEKIRDAGCICEQTKLINAKQREINAKTFDNRSLIYGDYREKTLDEYQAESNAQKHALNVARHYINDFEAHLKKGQNILFQGTYGTGKTHLAAAIRKSIADEHYKVLFMSVPDYIDKIKQEFSDKNQRHPISKMARDADLLVLDDVGANRMTEFEVSELFRLVDSRRGKCTIYTTNYNSKDFTKSPELARVFSRMTENTMIVAISGEDYRRRSMTI